MCLKKVSVEVFIVPHGEFHELLLSLREQFCAVADLLRVRGDLACRAFQVSHPHRDFMLGEGTHPTSAKRLDTIVMAPSGVMSPRE